MADTAFSSPAESKPPRILRWSGVHERTGIPRSSWDRGMRLGIYPQPIKLGPAPGRAVGWLERDIDALIDHLATTAQE